MWVRNAIWMPRPRPLRRSRRGSPPTKSSFRRRRSPEQKRIRGPADRISERTASGRACRAATSCAAAAAWPRRSVALNQVFGDCYEVDRRRGRAIPRRSRRSGPRTSLSSTCRPTTSTSATSGTTTRPTAGGVRNFFRMLRPDAKIMEQALELLNRAHYVKEVFGDSDTVMAIISGVPSRDWDKNPLPPDQMVATRRFVNDLAGSPARALARPVAAQPRASRNSRRWSARSRN